MRRSSSQYLSSSSDDFPLVGIDFPTLREPQKQQLEFGVGGFFVGGLLGILFGSRFTLHSPVRRRR